LNLKIKINAKTKTNTKTKIKIMDIEYIIKSDQTIQLDETTKSKTESEKFENFIHTKKFIIKDYIKEIVNQYKPNIELDIKLYVKLIKWEHTFITDYTSNINTYKKLIQQIIDLKISDMRENNFIIEILDKQIKENKLSDIGVNFTITCAIATISYYEAIEVSQLENLDTISNNYFKNISLFNPYGSIKLIEAK
jgi:hypothetical protein